MQVLEITQMATSVGALCPLSPESDHDFHADTNVSSMWRCDAPVSSTDSAHLYVELAFVFRVEVVI